MLGVDSVLQGTEMGVRFVKQAKDMLTSDWARVSMWAMRQASPLVSPSLNGDVHIVEHFVLCSFAHHACRPLLQGDARWP